MVSVQAVWQWIRASHKSKTRQCIESVLIILPIAFLIRTFLYGLYQVPTGSMETTMLVGDRFFADKLTIWVRPLKYGDIVTLNDPNYPYSSFYLIELLQRFFYGPTNWTKRIIGKPGDHIQGKIEHGVPVVYRNGQKIEEPYINQYPLIPLVRNKSIVHVSYDPLYPYDQQPFYVLHLSEVEEGKQWATANQESWLRLPGTPAYDAQGKNADIYDVHLGPDQYWVMGDNRLDSYDCRFLADHGRPLEGKLIHGRIVLRLWSIDSPWSWWIVDLLLHPFGFWKHVRWHRFFQWVV